MRTSTHRKNEIKAEQERERDREAHYNQAIMLAELEASLFSPVAARASFYGGTGDYSVDVTYCFE